MKKPDAQTKAFSSAVLLVCKDCRKRSSGPKKTKPKAVAQAVKQQVRGDQPRPRVLLSSCLGLCPKRATAVASVGGGEARIAAVAELDDLPAVVPRLREAAARPSKQGASAAPAES